MLALACLAAKPCLGGTIYTNMPSNQFLTINPYQFPGSDIATNFTTTDAGRLDSILVPLYSPFPAAVTITLYQDLNGQPGTSLESWSATPPGTQDELLTLTSVLHPSVFAGTKYWLVIAQNGVTVEWYQSNVLLQGGYWAGGGNPLQLTQEKPDGAPPAIALLSVDEPGPGCKSTFKSGTGPSFLAFCVTANGNMTVFQSPAGILHFLSNDRAEGYGFCDVNRQTSYIDYAAGGDSTSWDTPVTSQPNGPNTFPLETSRMTSDGAFTLTQSFSRDSADQSVNISMSLTNNTGFGREIYLVRFAHLLGNSAAPLGTKNYVDATTARGSAWAYNRPGTGVMLSAATTTVSHQGLVFASDSGPDPCNFLTTAVDPVAHPELFPYQNTAGLGTEYTFSIPAGKTVIVNVGYRPF